MNRNGQEGRSGMKPRQTKLRAPDRTLRGVAAILALAVRRMLRDAQNSKVPSTYACNRVAIILEKRLSVSFVSCGSGVIERVSDAACGKRTKLDGARKSEAQG